MAAVRSGSSAAAELFPASDPTQCLLRSTDWAATALGPVEDWPESLRAAVRTVLPSRVPMMVWWGPDLIQVYNHAAAPVIGGKHPTAIGQRAAECYHEAWAELGPLTETVLAGRGSTFSSDLFLQYERFGYTEETYWTFSYSPLRDGDQVGGLLVAAMDTTRQVLAERRLGLLHRLGDIPGTAAHGAPDAVRATLAVLERSRADVPFALAYLLDDARRNLTLVGSFGVDPDIVRDWSVVPGPDEAAPSWRAACSGEPVRAEAINARLGAVFEPSVLGDAVPDDALTLPLYDRATGTVAGTLALGINPYRALDEDYVAFCRSVARQVSTALTDALAYEEQRRRAEALAEIDAAKTRFLQNVSHELRTPLTLILGSIRALREDCRAHQEDVDVAERGALRLQRLVDSLLDFARADADELRAALEPTDLAAVTADVASMFRAGAERAGIRLTVDAAPLSRPVEVDPEMWVRIVANLLSNAVKFTCCGRIDVRLRQVGDDAVLTVADTGPGIAPQEMSRIFERFHQAPNTVGRSSEGAGIGLSLVSDLVRAHGGTVTVASDVGAGSAFTVRLPMGAADGAPRPVDVRTGAAAAFRAEADGWISPAPAEAPAEPPPSAESGHVLLVEDNADMRSYVGRLLRSDGWQVTAVPDAASALRMPAPTPDLVLCDVMLPGLDGVELVRMLRQVPATARLPVVLLTARAGPDSAADGLAAGADDYIVKPFDPRELLARVRAHVELARLREYAVGRAEDEVANLRIALGTNRQIGAAVGILMHARGLTNEEGFRLLRETSQRQNRKLRDIAEDVVRTGDLPAGPAAPPVRARPRQGLGVSGPIVR